MPNPRLTKALTKVLTAVVILAAACAFAQALGGPSHAQGGAAPSAGAGAQEGGDGRVRRRLFVGVRDERQNHVVGLTRSAFSVYARGKPVEVLSFSSGDEPASVAVLMDMSGSSFARNLKGRELKRADKVKALRGLLTTLLEAGHPSNEYFLLAFNHEVQVLLDGVMGPAPALAAADNFFQSAAFKGQTALFDACRVALDKLAWGRHQRRALVVVSDGQDNASRYNFGRLERALKEGDAILYAVVAFPEFFSGGITVDAGRVMLEELASVSGGATYLPPDEEALEAAAAHVALGLRNLYAIDVGLPAAAGRKDEWHELKVKVAEAVGDRGRSLKLKALARKGFYTPAAAAKAER